MIGIPGSVQGTLNNMLARVASFRALCESVQVQFGVINISTMEPEKGKPRALFSNGTVYVNEGMNHDDMVNSIVFELTNAMHSKTLAAAQDIVDVSKRSEAIERTEYQGVQVQSEIIKAAKAEGLVDAEMFGDLIGVGKRWETFEQYAKDQRASGHTGLYEKPKVDNSKCFLTSACVFARGLADDCDELTTLREFRDSYIMNLPGGPELVHEYYDVAPGIVDRIREDKDAKRILDSLYEGLVTRSVTLIRNGEYKRALEHYRAWVARLMNEFA